LGTANAAVATDAVATTVAAAGIATAVTTAVATRRVASAAASCCQPNHARNSSSNLHRSAGEQELSKAVGLFSEGLRKKERRERAKG
jgi:hypothetical protein